MTDNHGAWTLGCYGNDEILTPNIDRLAEQGVLFTRAFASNPVCSPTRATCLTGLIPSQHGVHSFLSAGRLQTGPAARCTLDELTSLPEVLRDQGYACGLVGKWHLGGNARPQEGLEDYWITMPHGGTSTFYDAPVIENEKVRKEPGYLTDLWTDHAVKFIETRAEQDQPFFLLLAYNGPYALGRLLLRDGRNRHADYYANKPMVSFPRSKVHPWQFNNRDFINNLTSIRRVATEVSGVDDGLGKVMDTLKEQGLDEQTVVVFVADQGWVGGQGGYFGMGDHTRPLTARDGMMQIPMIWRHPGVIAAGVRQDQMIANYDLMPTVLGHLGLQDQMPVAPKSPGTDFSSLLKNPVQESAIRDKPIFYEFENLRCIRTATHKYVHRYPNGPHELYDLELDPDEFVNRVDDPTQAGIRDRLRNQLNEFYSQYAVARYDLWNGGESQVRLHDGIDEELAQLRVVTPPPLPPGFKAAPIDVPEGFSVELAAGPPLVTHPTMAAFDDRGRLYVCNNAGVNMTNNELEEHLPNTIRQLVDEDGDGRFDSFHVFADKMTFPMGGVWHDGSLYVASPPHIWRLTDVDDDGVADQREAIVSQFGYNGNAASVHGCFFGPEGRLYWTDGYHGHEFKDSGGNVTSQREGSYIFSCLPDGSDKRIHCGGGMDNPVEIDFTDSGDMLGTVNILYTRPRVDSLVHWLHGGAYPHRQRVLNEIKVTGDLLTPAHRFGHVAVSGMTRYRSGVLDHRWGDDLFVTFFNSGKVVRLGVQPQGSTYKLTQHEFLASTSREFHPTDVLEDADGSLLVVDTGGWFYRGCPTSQFAKPELLGGIYRIRRDGMTAQPDPRGQQIAWDSLSVNELVRRLNDTRHAVRSRAVNEAVARGSEMVTALASAVKRADQRVRQNAILALTRLAQDTELSARATAALMPALSDALPGLRQLACRGLSFAAGDVDEAKVVDLLTDPEPAVRRQAQTTLGMRGDRSAVGPLIRALGRQDLDRAEEHAIIYALIEIGEVGLIREAMKMPAEQPGADLPAGLLPGQRRGLLMAISQIEGAELGRQEAMEAMFGFESEPLQRIALQAASGRPAWGEEISSRLSESLASSTAGRGSQRLLSRLLTQNAVAELAAGTLSGGSPSQRLLVLKALAEGEWNEPHEGWVKPVATLLTEENADLARTAIQVAAKWPQGVWQQELRAISGDDTRPIELRMDALAALHTGGVNTDVLEQLLGLYQKSISPTESDRAAQIIGSARLTQTQLQLIAPLLVGASPSQLRDLIRPFQRAVQQPAADQFLEAVAKSVSLLSLPEHELSDVIKRFPRESIARGNLVLDRLKQHHQQKMMRLQGFRDRLGEGDESRGKKLFASEKAKCSACHRVGSQGHAVGPDLTTIGSNRSANDLLESIVFPSASIVRDYATYQVLTIHGQVFSGVLMAESNDSIELQQSNGQLVRLLQSEVESISPGSVSIMPAGLDGVLSEDELLDVVKYLQSLK